jgi:hypothetical protein
VAAPVPLVSLEFGMSGGAIHAFNRGTSNSTAPEAQVINAEVSVACAPVCGVSFADADLAPRTAVGRGPRRHQRREIDRHGH